MKHLKLHKAVRAVSDATQEILCERLLRKDIPLEQKEQHVKDLKTIRESMAELEDANAKIHYNEGKKEGILIGEILAVGSYGLGMLIGHIIFKR